MYSQLQYVVRWYTFKQLSARNCDTRLARLSSVPCDSSVASLASCLWLAAVKRGCKSVQGRRRIGWLATSIMKTPVFAPTEICGSGETSIQ